MTRDRDAERAAKEGFLGRLRQGHQVERLPGHRSIWVVDDQYRFLVIYSKVPESQDKPEALLPYFFGLRGTDLLELGLIEGLAPLESSYVVFLCERPGQFLCVPMRVLRDKLETDDVTQDRQWLVLIGQRDREWTVKVGKQKPFYASEYLNRLPPGLEDAEPKV